MSVIKSIGLRWILLVIRIKGNENSYNILTHKPIGKRPLQKPKLRWEDELNGVRSGWRSLDKLINFELDLGLQQDIFVSWLACSCN